MHSSALLLLQVVSDGRCSPWAGELNLWLYLSGTRSWLLALEASVGLTSYSGFGTPISHLSNQPTMCSKRSMRCQGWPERESSCDSFGKRTIAIFLPCRG